MPPRKSRTRPPSSEPPTTGLLDWTDSRHWDYGGPRPCRWCEKPTQLRDGKGRPSHKVCAEAVMAERVAEAAQAYEAERLGE
ncbi:hypothetical protein [Streptomyces sp. NBC_01207]|uniref:hypothetical protein n=1 Tax=Streptomyces sp. NBC_01207 TaxID=2903772 RepID=UPI002E130281|nr:hypothetical protein OG457_27150 [Streptomyces sp. NBC_01207]